MKEYIYRFNIYISFNFISKMVVIVIIVNKDIVLIMVLIIRLLELFGVFVGEIRVKKC